MSTCGDNLLAARFAALAPEPLAGDWNDVLGRAGAAPKGRRRLVGSALQGRRGRRLVALAAAALVVAVATAAAFGTVRDFLFGTASTAWGGSPTWSPDGRRIAFTVHRWPDGPTEVYVMNADGSGQRNLTRESGLDVSPELWSPDWRKVVLLRNPCAAVQGACEGATQIYVMNADGSGLRRLARGGSVRTIWSGQRVGGDDGLAWSSDGRRIAFMSDRDRDFDIYVVNLDGSGQRNLTRKPGFDKDPVWSPDGRKIAFVSSIDERHPYRRQEIYVVNADGSGQRLLARGHAPAWSPDGRKIAFRSDRDGNGEIYVMNADGTGQRRLTRDPDSDGGPVWSPDGRKILFVRAEFRRGNSEIYVMNADGSGQRNLSRNPASDGEPSWSHDGRRIAFVSKRDGNGEVYVMNADGSAQRNLTRLRGGT
jgi:Tol biopolymer transport system component